MPNNKEKAPVLTIEKVKSDPNYIKYLHTMSYDEAKRAVQRDADHDFYTLPEEETIEKMARKIYELDMEIFHSAKGAWLSLLKEDKDIYRQFATQLYNNLFKEKK